MTHYLDKSSPYNTAKLDTSFDLAYVLAQLKIYGPDWWYCFRDKNCEA